MSTPHVPEIHPVPEILSSYTTASGEHVIKFEGVKTLRTRKSYTWLVIEIGYHPTRYSSTAHEYIATEPRAYVRRGSSSWKYIERHMARCATRSSEYWTRTFVVRACAVEMPDGTVTTGFKVVK